VRHRRAAVCFSGHTVGLKGTDNEGLLAPSQVRLPPEHHLVTKSSRELKRCSIFRIYIFYTVTFHPANTGNLYTVPFYA
jgi:hypothetical protein